MTEHHPLLIRKDGLSLSGQVIIELIKAVHEKGRPFRFCAKGFSMSPFVKDEDMITVAPVKKFPVRLGDIVAFVHPETKRLVVHRTIKKKGDYFVIRGDNAPSEDGIIPAANILGRITKVEREGRKVFLGLGLERRIIAFFSDREILSPLRYKLFPFWKIVRPLFKKVLS